MKRILAILAAVALLAAAAREASAQVDPFGTTPAPATPATPAPAGAAPPAASGLSGKEDPVVSAFRQSNPSTPDELLTAAKAMLNYDRADEAKRYVQKLLEMGLDRAALRTLERKFGTSVLLRMQRDPRMQPEGGQLAEAVYGADQSAAKDVPRLEDLVKQLSNPSLGVRSNALHELRAARLTAIDPMLKALADKSRSREHPYIRAAFEYLELEDAEPLLGALESPDDDLKAQVVAVLGSLKAREAVEFLIEPYLSPHGSPKLQATAARALEQIVGTVPTRSEANAYLRKRVRDYFGGMQPSRVDVEGMVTLWHWDADRQTSVPLQYRAVDAPLIGAMRAAQALYRLNPDNGEYQRLFLTAGLEAAKMVGGLDRPLEHGTGTAYAAAAAAGPQTVEQVLQDAMKDGRIGAAIGAAEVLGDVGTTELLVSNNGYPRPLAAALQHADRRLQFTAARSIVKIDPHQDFPGASHVPEVLAFAAGTAGMLKMLIADPRPQSAQSLAGTATQLGYEGEAAFTGRQAIKMALSEPDYAFAMISDTIDKCDVNELYQMLRKDPRTARMPVAVLARDEEYLRRWKTRLEDDRLAEAFLRPYTPDGMLFITDELMRGAGRLGIGEAERLTQASQALDDLLLLAEKPVTYRFYDLTRHQAQFERSLFTPGLAAKSAQILGLLGTPRAQKALVDRASLNATDLAERQAAAKAFADAVALRGTLLTTRDIQLQYDRYNQSEELDVDTQKVLSSILDAIEARVRKK